MCFFFSSRRRHTRWPRDWSSDVCSSDLKAEKMAKIHNTVNAQRQRRQRLQGLIQRLVARRQASKTAQVDVRRQLHANVNITIDGVSHTYTHDMGPRCLVRRGAELVSKS